MIQFVKERRKLIGSEDPPNRVRLGRYSVGIATIRGCTPNRVLDAPEAAAPLEVFTEAQPQSQ